MCYPTKPNLVDLRDIKILKKLGRIIDDTKLIKGLVFDKKVTHVACRLFRLEDAKIAYLIYLFLLLR